MQLTISPAPTQDEEDAVVAALLLHQQRAVVAGGDIEREQHSRWLLVGRRAAHRSRLSADDRSSDLPNWLEQR